MANNGMRFEVTADADKAIGALEDVANAAEEMSDDVAKAGEKLEDSAKDSEKALNNLGDAAEDMAADVQRAGAELADAANQADEGASRFGKLGEVFAKLGPALAAGAAAAGAAAGAALMGGVMGGITREQDNAKLAAQLGLPPDVAKEAGAAAGKIYAGAYGESLGEVNDAIRFVANNITGLDEGVTPEVEAISKSVLDLASAFDVDLASSTAAVGQMMKTGLADNAAEAMDIITRGFQQGVDKSGDFLDTLNEYGTQFRKFGLDGAAATGLLTQGIAAGARDADLVADSIKEFSIRAIDGSKATADGFKAIGLNAGTMARTIAKGGPEASKALDLTLDRLRAIKDPVKQSAAAVQLFGTQAEDMGAALFALDPSAAVGALGDVAGAANRMGETLGNTTAAKFESFKRGLENAMVGAGAGIFDLVSALADDLGPALDGITKAGRATWEWFKRNADIIVPLAAGVLAGVAAWKAYVAITTLWAARTKVAIALQTAWNAAMALNPIGIVIAALAALGVALFVLYKRSETFRKFVDGMWREISKVAKQAWEGVLKPALTAIGAALMVLWTNVVKPYLTFIIGLWIQVFQRARQIWDSTLKPALIQIGQAISTLWTNYVKPYLGFVLAFWGKVFSGLRMFWDNVLRPVFSAIFATIGFLWQNVVRPVFGFIWAYWQTVFAGMSLVWEKVLRPVFSAIAATVGWLWRSIVKPIFTVIGGLVALTFLAIKTVWDRVLSPVFRAIGALVSWLYEKAFKPALENMRRNWATVLAALKIVYDTVLRPVFDFIGRAVGVVRDKFKAAVDGIKGIWDRLKGIVQTPIVAVISVINKGIIDSWNWVDKKALGGKFHIDRIVPPKFAEGGIAPGWTPGRDNQFAAVSGGEAIMRPEWTRAVGPEMIHAWNRAAKVGGTKRVREMLGFADGGIFGSVKALGSKVWDTATTGVKAIADFLANPSKYLRAVMTKGLDVLNQFRTSVIGRGITDVPGRLIGQLADAAKGFVFGTAAHGATGPLALGGSGSQAVDAIMAMARRFYPGAMLSSGVRNTNDYHGQGLAADIIGGGARGMETIARGFFGISNRLLELIHSGGPGYFVKNGRVVGRNYYASVIGQHYNHVHVAARRDAMLFDQGGYLEPGLTLAMNNTGRRERVLPPGSDTETMTAPIVLKLDSETVYRGLLRFKRRLGGGWELA